MTLIVLLIVGLLGLFAHWFKSWARGQTESSFFDYMMTHKKHSAASVITLFGAIATLFASGDIELTNQTLAMGFMAGFTIDATVNKSPEES